MGYDYTWRGTVDSSWTDLANWDTDAGIAPQTGSLTDTSDSTATVIFDGGPTVDGYGTANFFFVDNSQTFAGSFSADGQPAIGLSPFFTAFQVTGGTATFTGATTHLQTQADVLVGYGDPQGAPAAELVFSNGATANLNTNQAIDYLGNRIPEFSLYIGYDHTGSVDIEGAKTSVTTDSGIAIGFDSGVSGSLHVGSGAHLEIGSLYSNYGFAVGDFGPGSLLIDGAATVKADGGVDIGTQFGSIGQATVTGAGSDFHAAQSIYVGTPSTNPAVRAADGVGTLTVSNGATVESDSSIKVYSGSVLNVLGGSTLSSTGLSGVGARIQVLAGGVVNLSGSTISASGTNSDDALEGVQVEQYGLISGYGAIIGTYVALDGTINADSLGASQTLLVNSLAKPSADPATPGVFSISGDATLELKGGVASSDSVVFNNTAEAGFHETLEIDGAPSTFQATIGGLEAGDAIDLTGVTGATSWALNTTTDVLQVSNAAGAVLASLQLSGNFAGTSFTAAADGSGGFVLTQTKAAKAPVITSGDGRTANYVLNRGFTAITNIQASGEDVQYFLKDARTGKLVSSTGGFSINEQTGALSFNKSPGYGDYDVTVVAKNAAGQASQTVDVDVTGSLMFGGYGAAETYVFHAGFGSDFLLGFSAGSHCGDGKSDVLQLDHSLFTGATQGETGSALVALLQAHSTQGCFGAEINTDTGDHLLLVGVSEKTLLADAATDVRLV